MRLLMLEADNNSPETVTIRLKDGAEIECGIVSIFPVQQINRQFIALNPLDDTGFGRSDEIQLFSLIPSAGANRYELAEIDESIFNLALEEFFNIMEA